MTTETVRPELAARHTVPAGIYTRREFGDLLTELRERAGLTVRDIAKATDVPYSTIGGYMTGRHLPPVSQAKVLPDILRACGVAEHQVVERWCRALERLRRLPAQRQVATRQPYTGLASFETGDWFFGRERLTRMVLRELGRCWRSGTGPVAVVGPSGCGKSSLVHAGVLPALDRSDVVEGGRGWRALSFTPGLHPVDALASALAPVIGEPAGRTTAVLRSTPHRCADLVMTRDDGRSSPLLIIVDQIEEVLAGDVDAGERDRFLAALQAASTGARPAAAVLLALRSDAQPEAEQEPGLRSVLRQAQVDVGPMTESELRDVITGPAHRAGLDIEAGLVELLLRDLAPPPGLHGIGSAHEAGTLALLSQTLLSIWTQSGSRRLTVADYQRTGGVGGVVVQIAEDAFAALSDPEQEQARFLLLRLVRVAEDVPDARRRVSRRVLEREMSGSRGANRRSVLGTLVRHRLVTVDADMVRLSHDALVSGWPRMRAWINTDRSVRDMCPPRARSRRDA